MSITSQPDLNSFELPPYPVRRFTVDEYHQFVRAGVLTEDDPVELLEGWIAAKMPRDPQHDAAVDLAAEALRVRLPPGWRVRIQSAVTTYDSEPEPDLAVVRGQARDYASRHPGPGDIALVIEVAQTSLAHDRLAKSRVYARAAIPVYWIVNLVDRQVEVYSQPSGIEPAEYLQQVNYAVDSEVPITIDGAETALIQVREIMP